MSTWEDTLEELIQQGDLTGSLGYINHRLLQTDVASVDQIASLLVIRAQLLRELGQHAAAASSFRQAGQLGGPKLTIRLVALFESAREFIGLEEYSEAMEVLALALKEAKDHLSELPDDRNFQRLAKEPMLVDSGFDPSAPPSEVVGRILLLRAQAARLSQNRDLALQDVSEIVDTLCTSEVLRAAALLDRGVIHFENGESAKASEDFLYILSMERSLERHKCDASYNLSLIYASEGDYLRLTKSLSAFFGSPLPPVQVKRVLAESIREILANAEADEAVTVKEAISSFMRNYE